MENNEVSSVVTQQPTGQENQAAEPAKESATGSNSESQRPERTFTRDEVTTILKKRIDRYQNSVYRKYGVKNLDEFNSLIDKAKQYDDIVKSRDELTETVAFLRNNINPQKYDDIKTYFKGKGLQFTEDSLKQQLSSHPEWLNKQISKPTTTITPVGTEQSGITKTGEKEVAEKMFGMSL